MCRRWKDGVEWSKEKTRIEDKGRVLGFDRKDEYVYVSADE